MSALVFFAACLSTRLFALSLFLSLSSPSWLQRHPILAPFASLRSYSPSNNSERTPQLLLFWFCFGKPWSSQNRQPGISALRCACLQRLGRSVSLIYVGFQRKVRGSHAKGCLFWESHYLVSTVESIILGNLRRACFWKAEACNFPPNPGVRGRKTTKKVWELSGLPFQTIGLTMQDGHMKGQGVGCFPPAVQQLEAGASGGGMPLSAQIQSAATRLWGSRLHSWQATIIQASRRYPNPWNRQPFFPKRFKHLDSMNPPSPYPWAPK